MSDSKMVQCETLVLGKNIGAFQSTQQLRMLNLISDVPKSQQCHLVWLHIQ